MKKQNTFLISGTILGLLLLAYPFFSGNAQKVENTNKTSEQDAAMEAIKKSVVANSFYEKLQQGEKSKNNSWTLTRAQFTPKSPLTKEDNVSLISLKTSATEVMIIIREHSIGDTMPSYFGPISQGYIKECKGGLCGDEGRKIYGTRGFSGLQFRKDNYFVSISCNSITCDIEETAMRFADYALKAIAEK